MIASAAGHDPGRAGEYCWRAVRAPVAGRPRVLPASQHLLDNARVEAGERFTWLAKLFEGVTRGHFERLGVRAGWRCWEVNAGGHWYWRSDADGNATWGPTSRPVPQWTRPGATPVETLGRHGNHH